VPITRTCPVSICLWRDVAEHWDRTFRLDGQNASTCENGLRGSGDFRARAEGWEVCELTRLVDYFPTYYEVLTLH